MGAEQQNNFFLTPCLKIGQRERGKSNKTKEKKTSPNLRELCPYILSTFFGSGEKQSKIEGIFAIGSSSKGVVRFNSFSLTSSKKQLFGFFNTPTTSVKKDARTQKKKKATKTKYKRTFG